MRLHPLQNSLLTIPVTLIRKDLLNSIIKRVIPVIDFLADRKLPMRSTKPSSISMPIVVTLIALNQFG